MSKKDYILIANELRSQHEMLGYNDGQITGSETSVYEMSCKLWAQTFSMKYSNFNKKMFLEACGIK